MASKGELGWYALPVVPAFEGGDKAVNDGMGKILGKLGDLGKRSGASLGKGLGDGLKSAEAEVKKATDAYEKLRDKAADALGKVRTEEEKLAKARSGGKTDQIVAAEERLAKARRDATRANKEAAASHSSLLDFQGRLANHTDRLGSSFTGLNGKLAGLASHLGDVGERFGGVGGRIAGSAANIASGFAGISTGGSAAAAAVVGVGSVAAVAVAAVAALGAGAAVVGKQFYDLGAQFDDLRDKLQIDTGASGAELQGLVDTVERLGTTTVASSFADIGPVLADVTRNLHLTGPALDDVTSRIANLNRMTGQAVNVKDLGMVFRGFGVDAEDQAAALNSLYEASTKTGLSVNEMLSVIGDKGATLRQFGLSVGESAALIGQFESRGIPAEKAIASMTKAFGVLADKGLPARQGLQDVIGQVRGLLDAGREAEAADLANSFFGAKGGVNFFDAIKSGAIDLQSLSSAMQTTGMDINQVAQDTGDWSESWQILKNKAAEALEPLGTTVFNFVNEKLEALSGWVVDHKDEIIDFFVSFGSGAITAAEMVVKGVGYIAGAIGDIIAPIGDVMGTLLKGQAWIDEHIRGNKEAAEESRKLSEQMYGLGEDFQRFGDAASNVDFESARTGLRDLGDQAKNASDSSIIAADGLGGLATGTQSVAAGLESVPWDAANGGLSGLSDNAATGTTNFKAFTESLADASGAVSLFGTAANGLNGLNGALDPATILGSGGSLFGAGANGSASIYNGPTTQDTGGGITPATAGLQAAVQRTFTGVTVGGYRKPDGFNEHSSGTALDVMVSGKAQGDAINQWMLANADRLGIDYTIWQQKTWKPGQAPQAMPDRGSPTANHMDHVHARVKSGGNAAAVASATAGPAAAPTVNATTTTGLPGAVADLGTAASSPIDLSANDISNAPVNAFGPEYEAGYGTPGYKDGDPGYWRADPKQVREANQRAQDAMNRILDADAAVAAALARVNELDADASESQRQAAQESVRKAQVDAQVARREAQDAKSDAEEAKKGDFTAAKKASKDKKSKDGKGGSEFGELGNIFGSFLKETFGLDGSIFPDLSDLAPVKALGTVLGAFKDPMQAAIDGTGGAGGTALDPFGGAVDVGPSTSTLPFGMIPGVSSLLPPTSPSDPAAPSLHRGGGAAPGPIDQSTRITINNPQGDEASIANRTRQTLLRTPRLGTYTPPGVGQ